VNGFHLATWGVWFYLRCCMWVALGKVALWDHWHHQLSGLWPF